MGGALSWQAQCWASGPEELLALMAHQGAVKESGWEGWMCQHGCAMRAGGPRCGSSLRSNAPVEPWKLLQGGMQGPYCQIHCFVEDCIQSYSLICCLSIGISSFLKCFW